MEAIFPATFLLKAIVVSHFILMKVEQRLLSWVMNEQSDPAEPGPMSSAPWCNEWATPASS